MTGMAKSITVGLLAVGLLSGCSNDAQKWYGRWEGDLGRVSSDIPDDPKKRTINLVRIDIKADGTFEMLESGFDKSGTHKLGSEKAFLRVKTLLGRSVESLGPGTQAANQDLILTWQEDGTVLYKDPAGFDEAPVVLRRTAR